MKNPFPGMNPYLQQRWGDFHTSFTVAISDALNQSLPEDLVSRIEETLEPNWAMPRDDPRTARHIEIIASNAGRQVTTAIEILCPANKSNAGCETYRKKQAKFVAARINLVEIDLVRSGTFVLAIPERTMPWKCCTPYVINVRRAIRPATAELYSVPLREPLPNIPIPLRPTDSDLVLQLQPLLDECYERGRYRMNYQQPPDPPLPADDDAWANQLLREQGLRP